MHPFLPPNLPDEHTQTLRELSGTYQIGVPHSDGILYADFPHQQAVHPPKRELHELDVLYFQMRCERSYSPSKYAYSEGENF